MKSLKPQRDSLKQKFNQTRHIVFNVPFLTYMNEWKYTKDEIPNDMKYKMVAIRIEGYYCYYTIQKLAYFKNNNWYNTKNELIDDFVFAWKSSRKKANNPDFKGFY